MWQSSVLVRQLTAALLLVALVAAVASAPGRTGETVRHVLEDLLTTSYDGVWASQTFYSLMADEQLRPVIVPMAHRLGFAREVAHDTVQAAQRHALLAALPAPVEGLVVASFGWHGEPPRLREGLTFRASAGSPVRAAAAGQVQAVAAAADGQRQLTIQHDHEVATQYEGSVEMVVAPGAAVEQGQVLGHLQGERLHFQLHIQGRAIDPAPKLVLQP